MVQAVVGVHVLVCITLVILILLQQGKGAEVGAVFGGSSNTVFGASGAGNVLTRTTSALAVVFFATSLYLAYASSQRASGSIFGSGSSVMSKHVAPAKAPLVPNATGTNVAPNSNPLVPNAEPNSGAPNPLAPPASN
jgi:preprotein translocase subunit SecG